MDMPIVRLLAVISRIFQNGILYCKNILNKKLSYVLFILETGNIHNDYIYRSIKFNII